MISVVKEMDMLADATVLAYDAAAIAVHYQSMSKESMGRNIGGCSHRLC